MKSNCFVKDKVQLKKKKKNLNKSFKWITVIFHFGGLIGF